MLTESEIEAMGGEPLTVDVDAWQAEVLRLIHRCKPTVMVDDGRLDVLDLLLIAPILAGEEQRAEEMDEYERRRLRHLENLKIDWTRIYREDAI